MGLWFKNLFSFVVVQIGKQINGRDLDYSHCIVILLVVVYKDSGPLAEAYFQNMAFLF